MSRPKLTEDQKLQNKLKRQKEKNVANMNAMAARQMKNIFCLADNEVIVDYTTTIAENGYLDVEIRTMVATNNVPYLQHNFIKFSFKKVDHKKYLEEKLNELGYTQPEIS